MGCCLTNGDHFAFAEDTKELKDDKKEVMVDIPFNELAKRHKAIRDKYENVQLDDIKEDINVTKLMKFTGYYQIDTVTGAFLSVDTNIHVKYRKSIPLIDILISLDGISCNTYHFNGNGTFDGKKLIMNHLNISLDLDFTRHNSNSGIIASFSGSIAFKNTIKTISGSTFNNPIPYSMYIGEYYEKDTILPVMKIKDDYQLEYDYNGNHGELQPVSIYTYNLNMHYFSFEDDENNNFRLLMGTSAGCGFVCNNISILDFVHPLVVSRTLQTVILSNINNVNQDAIPKDDGKLLAPFSGYYPINCETGSFISIEAEYTFTSTSTVYKVSIGVSMDGITSDLYVYDETMSFDDDTLIIPDVLHVDLVREYNTQNESIIQLRGDVMDEQVTGYTAFSPVHLSAFNGKYYLESNMGIGSLVLNIINGSNVIYNGITMTSFTYLPLMHILTCSPPPIANLQTEAVMSFGTDGAKGNTCIITQYDHDKHIPGKITIVYEITDPL